MNSLILVMLGGASGAAMRYLVGIATLRFFGPSFPWGTLSANLVGGLAMGLLAGMLARFGQGGEQLRLLLGVGVLGGFTTFSSFSLETYVMFERGATLTALGYIAVSVVGSIVALGLGLMAARALA